VLEEDALAGTDQGCSYNCVLMLFGNEGLAFGHSWIVEDSAVFAHIGDAVFEQGENLGYDIDAQPISGAEILIDPNVKLVGLDHVERSTGCIGILGRHRRSVLRVQRSFDTSSRVKYVSSPI